MRRGAATPRVDVVRSVGEALTAQEQEDHSENACDRDVCNNQDGHEEEEAQQSNSHAIAPSAAEQAVTSDCGDKDAGDKQPRLGAIKEVTSCAWTHGHEQARKGGGERHRRPSPPKSPQSWPKIEDAVRTSAFGATHPQFQWLPAEVVAAL